MTSAPTTVSGHEHSNAVTSVRRALDVLRLAAERGGVTVTEVAIALEVHKSTASRLLATMADERFLERSPASRRFELGPEVLRLSGSTTIWTNLTEFARPSLEELAEFTGTITNVGVLSGHDVIHIEQANGRRSPGDVDWVRRSAPLHCTSMGKVLLAFAPRADRARLLTGPLQALTPATITDRKRLEEELEEVRRLGVASALGEFQVGMNGVAAPIRRADGTVIAALCASGPPGVLGPNNVTEVAAATRVAANSVSMRLGA